MTEAGKKSQEAKNIFEQLSAVGRKPGGPTFGMDSTAVEYYTDENGQVDLDAMGEAFGLDLQTQG